MFSFTMKKVMMNVLITFAFFIFTSQMLHIFGKVILLRGSKSPEKPYHEKVICLSEDDGGALVWNYDLFYNDRFPIKNDFKFQELNDFSNNELDCKMNANQGCLESWTKNNWSLTNSVKTSMGPVFDQRWEEFKQYEAFRTYNSVDLELTTEVKLPFSVRVYYNAHILICNGTNYHKDLCYWITIRNWDRSVIRKCMTGVPESGQYPPKDSECNIAQNTSMEDVRLSNYEWRSFIITWNSEMRRIIIYDTDKIIMTYTDEKKPLSNNLYTSNNYHMFIGSDTDMSFRFHIYDFLHTTVESAVLTSPVFQFNNEMICVHLLIGLCVECDAHVVLRNYTNNKVLAVVTAKGSSRANPVHNLPMWHSVKVTTNFSATNYNSYNRAVIQLIPKLNDHRFVSPLWAIANVRQCPQNEALRTGTVITSTTIYYEDILYNSERISLNVSCQKLFYDEHTVVISLANIKPDIIPDDANCPEGKIGPQCLFSCKSDLDSNFDCQETSICYKHGCTCAPRFLGNTCSKRIKKPNAPTIIFTNETTIWANVSVTWKKEYRGTSILYSFVIQELNQYQQSWNKLFPNITQLTKYFENLKPGTTYHIGFILAIAGASIYSDWQVAETMCNPAKHFSMLPEEDSITIDWQMDPNQLYSCPANCYYVVVNNMRINTNENISVTSFPYKLQNLTSYTSFGVTIVHKHQKLFSQEIRTLEGVPSKVLNLQSRLTNTQLNLIWSPPREPNGEIIRYEIILKVKEYYGCKDLKLSTPDNHVITKFTIEPMITISDLHPYTSYSAQVIAHNARHFSMAAEIIFNTEQSDIPSEVFRELRVDGWILSWHSSEDCTTISGPLKARIKIHGISDAVKYFNITEQTSRYYLDLDQLYPKLYGFERYVATVYVIRDFNSKENASANQTYEFETPPKAPPSINNLEITELDTRQTPAMMHLRWQSPLPPLNGKLRSYGVEICNANGSYCSVTEVRLNESCDLWDDYICKIVKKSGYSSLIKVFAYNINVTEPGHSVLVTDDMLRSTTPDVPRNYTFTINNNSVVDLKWLHPWKTGDHLKSFRIQIQQRFSNLRGRISRSLVNETLEYNVTQYMRNYTKSLDLFPSTQYIIYIQAVTVANKSSDAICVEIRTPSTANFDGVLNATVDKSESTILLNIPSVLNDTQDSMMHIIVKGPNLCKQYSKVPENLRVRAGIKKNETAWLAAEVSINKLAGGRFIIGDDRIYDNAKNCPLKSEEFYEIVIIVTERNSSTKPIMLAKSIHLSEVPSKYYEVWIVPIVLFLVVTGADFYACRRRRQKLPEQQTQDEIDFSRNIKNYEQKTTSVVSNSMQDPSTPFDRQSLSRVTTPEVSIAIVNDEEKVE